MTGAGPTDELSQTAPVASGGESGDALSFGAVVDGLPEFRVFASDLLLDCYVLQPDGRSYCQLNPVSCQRIRLSDCLNRDDVARMLLPGGRTLAQYLEAGLDSLYYCWVLHRRPILADFFDNPGLLLLLAARGSAFSDRELRNCSRRDLLSKLLRSTRVGNRHVRRLAKVRPVALNPFDAPALLEGSLLADCLDHGHSLHAREEKIVRTLLSHEPRWSERGLRYFARLLADQGTDWQSHRRTVRYLNYPGSYRDTSRYEELVTRMTRVIRDSSLVGDAPPAFLDKLAAFANDPCDSRLLRLRRIVRVLDSPENAHRKLFGLAELLMEDSDIPEPILAPDAAVRHLDTCEALISHARQQRNCVWSTHMINRYLLAEVDILEYHGSSLITVSIDRSTCWIEEMQPAPGAGIHADDLGVLMSWYQEAVRKRGAPVLSRKS